MIKKYLDGDIVLIPFPFSDLSENKIRPAVILAKDKEDFVCVFITSVKPKDDLNLKIDLDKTNNLKSLSYVRYSKFASLDNKITIGKIGKLSDKDFKHLKAHIKKFLNL